MLVVGIGLAAGCSGVGRVPEEPAARPKAGVHVVRPGETLYGIAAQRGLDYRDLARWNGLGDGSRIYPGQRLRLGPAAVAARPPAATPDSAVEGPVPDWGWPAPGPVIARFGESARTTSGILIGGERGQAVLAAAPGEVVYAGSGLTGYGLLVILRHDVDWLSAYGHNDALLVREGQRVAGGALIARMGEGPGRRPALHFEIRRQGAPLDPLDYLPRRP